MMDLCCWLLRFHWTSEDKAQAVEGRNNPFMFKTDLKSNPDFNIITYLVKESSGQKGMVIPE